MRQKKIESLLFILYCLNCLSVTFSQPVFIGCLWYARPWFKVLGIEQWTKQIKILTSWSWCESGRDMINKHMYHHRLEKKLLEEKWSRVRGRKKEGAALGKRGLRPEGSWREPGSYSRWKNILDRGNSKCKSPGAEAHLVCSRNCNTPFAKSSGTGIQRGS